jgi:hypothetical protein
MLYKAHGYDCSLVNFDVIAMFTCVNCGVNGVNGKSHFGGVVKASRVTSPILHNKQSLGKHIRSRRM